uniref:RNA polymerase I subunit G n=1 Tax=Oreochromis niloticus TaxID=8128 RepID=A0A669BE90_ORENI
MPKDISSSSSEDEADTTGVESAAKPTESGKYQCPPDFVSFCHEPCRSTLAQNLKKNKNELWLIKAPASFDPKWWVQSTGSGQQIYSILASNHSTSELRLLTSDKKPSNGIVVGPAFSGLLNVCETYGDSSNNQAPQVIPAALAPSIPPGLKQRFQPFGSKTPTLTCVAENELDGVAFGPSSTTLRPLVVKRFVEEAGQEEDEEEEEEEGRKKKKKKKEKRIKKERLEEVVNVKEEPVDEFQEEVMMELPFQEGDYSVEKRKKKKKKKDREREEVEEGLEPSVKVKTEEVPVKCEPMDTFFGEEVEGSGRKKKKKKKLRTDGD